MPDSTPIVMPLGKFAGKHPSELPSTYIVHALENTNMMDEIKDALLNELHIRFFKDNINFPLNNK